ncbi:hypothetical protein D1007_26342 [Hordeum vulgare]|uniref:uncharacterized protein LOC123431037 n=1 Tax=Hordeum vulgare subsp. vulgare TaxID=112509 RepID=UPI001D1A4D5D|nr:uncharacterized protein LOC123431037 [Hordeum vulgare subsp. vulgare]KAE8798467.1 hypothetical protein D1007_26342 [Hordeum vulgare]KAI5010278.1 hypothetical protein ZWY2020_012415 [Hordeum vulgare]
MGMGLDLLVAFAVARVFAQLSHVSSPLRWPLNPWLRLARHLPEACAVVRRVLTAYLSWLRLAYARGGTVWGRRSRDNDDVFRQALLEVSY